MKVLELFAGSCSFSNVAKARGHETFTVDYIQYGKIDLVEDLFNVSFGDIPFKPDIIWASPPCTTFSIASCSKHWTAPDEYGNREPKTEAAHDGLLLLEQTIWLMNEIQPKYYLIENPRGLMRKMPIMLPLPRYTVSYCQYGDKRMKPTDIWTNLEFDAKMCQNRKPNNICHHEKAPRGSQTGTQGLKDAYERSKVPEELCLEIIKVLENEI
jgi:site-specific DNA-cytosine methylase